MNSERHIESKSLAKHYCCRLCIEIVVNIILIICSVRNKIIPQRNPNSTIDVWNPIKAPSRLTSRHHWNVIIIKNKILINNKSKLFIWNHFNRPEVKPNPLNEANNGQGDSSTKWKGWRNKLDIGFYSITNYIVFSRQRFDYKIWQFSANKRLEVFIKDFIYR